MKVNKNAIRRYKVNQWYDLTKDKFQFGIDVVMNDYKTYHCFDGKDVYLFQTREEAEKLVKQFNAELLADKQPKNNQ